MNHSKKLGGKKSINIPEQQQPNHQQEVMMSTRFVSKVEMQP